MAKERFEEALEKLEGFASFYGPDFYRLPRNTDIVELSNESWTVPETLPFGETVVVPFRAAGEITWRLV